MLLILYIFFTDNCVGFYLINYFSVCPTLTTNPSINDGWSSLPPELKVKIFLYLQGGSLHSCRQVCREWNDFILENIWKSKDARKVMEMILKDNMFIEEAKHVKTVETVKLKMKVKIIS